MTCCPSASESTFVQNEKNKIERHVRGVWFEKGEERAGETHSRFDCFERRPQERTNGLDQELKRENSRFPSTMLERMGGGDPTVELGGHGGERRKAKRRGGEVW